MKHVACIAGGLFLATSAQAADFVAPADYREWIYLSTGLDMNYNEAPRVTDRGNFFSNVFVNPEAYRAFVKTGTWPDKTTFVLEIRRASGVGSINKGGKFQAAHVGLEYHVKENGLWTFYGPRNGDPVAKIPAAAECYSCHEQHAAVDTTFVQFYPTLLEIAKAKGTLSAAYLKAEAANALPPVPVLERKKVDAALRSALEDLLKPEPTYAAFAQQAADETRAAMRQYLKAPMAKLGALKSLIYMTSVEPVQHVTYGGAPQKVDQYQATYERGWIQWRVYVSPEEKVERLVPFSINAPGTE